jgi:DNA phosphorothioation-dependent restriction protein DptH
MNAIPRDRQQCCRWAEGGRSKKKPSRQETLLAKFGREGAVQIPLSRMLKTIEQRILAEPKHPSGWRMQINLDTAEPPSEVGLTLPSSNAMAPSWRPAKSFSPQSAKTLPS